MRFRLESNRLAAKRAYYRRLDKVAAMQQVRSLVMHLSALSL